MGDVSKKIKFKMIFGLIPSRISSSRLKKKALIKIDGIPIVAHTYKRALMSKLLNEVIVCTDSKEIGNVIKNYGGNFKMTSKKHQNGTERIAEVARKLKKAKLIIDIQGDEPLLNPTDIDNLIKFHQKNINNFDIVVPCIKGSNLDSKNIVKVIFNKNGKVLYLSRSSVPFDYKNQNINLYKHLSVISFKRESLIKFSKLKMTKYEKIEGIELLRAIENDMKVGTFVSKSSSFAVDVKSDLEKARIVMKNDPLRKEY